MKIHSWENAFLAAGATVLLACGAVLIYTTVVIGIHLPGDHGRIDPAQVTTTPPFDAPGVRQLADGRYEAVVIGRAWSFEPAEIRVPAGVEVVFTATTTDVIHGLNVEGTRLNMMLIPGQISQNSYTFKEPGEYLLICHEYCGLGHHMMAGRVIVEEGTAGVAATSARTDGEVR
ncbi:MAG: cytochrome c oxidase subunit II [Gemmatimonadetes bacterium]|nr:cytochrome c oxidase subunit II [Gemmatimonadota bacterium]